MRILAFDPSINHIGTAIYQDNEIETHTIETTSGIKEVLAKTLPIYLRRFTENQPRCDVLIIEYPNFQNSTRGKIAAQQGYVADLAFVVGFIASQINAVKCVFPSPNKWKGQTPKDIVGQRFQAWTGINYKTVSDHEYEAAMMIRWYLLL